MRQLIYNAVTCTECKEILVSYSVHDYKTCSCPNDAMVDGGLSYSRHGEKDMDKIIVHNIYDRSEEHTSELQTLADAI